MKRMVIAGWICFGGVFSFLGSVGAVEESLDVGLNVSTAPEIHVNPMSGFVVTNKVGQQQNRILVVSNAVVADGNLDFDVGTLATDRDGIASLAAENIAGPSPEHDFTTIPSDAEYKPGYLLVRWSGESLLTSQSATVASMGGKVTSRYKSVPGLCLVELAEDTTVEEALASYNSAAGVLYAHPNYVWHIDRTPDDTRLNDLWGMHNTGQTGGTSDADIDAPEAWEVATGSSEIVVAVIDTGVDYNHPDLDDNMWVNTGEIPNNNLDDDGNGYIDDIYGYDFVNDDGDPLDDHDHGTHCAGTIGAEGDNAVGVVGVCWDVRIMAIKFMNSSGSGSTADAIASVEYAMQMGAKVLSNSWGGGRYDQALKDAIDSAGMLGIPFIAAAGNDGTDNDNGPHYPSNYDSENIISVISSDHRDARSSFSNYGLISTDLAAPGSSILSCVTGGAYRYQNGTSMAAPHVAGACALMLSINPWLTSTEIKQILMDTVDPTLPGICVSGGRLNLKNAIAESGVPWISVSPENGSGLAPGDSINITVSFDATDMAAGTYAGEVAIASNDPLTPNVEIPIQMYVEPDDLVVSPLGSLESNGVVGGPFSPTSVEYGLTNNGIETIDWTVANSEAWANISSTSGSLAAGAATSVTVSINSVANWLSAGEYTDQIIFSNLVSGARQTREAKLDIVFPPPVVIHSFHMDSVPGWTTEGQWEFGQPAGVGGDPVSGHTGPNVYGYNLAGRYPDGMSKYWLTTTALDCSGYTNITLKFQRWLGVESSLFDHADIEISNDGSTWQTVWAHAGGRVSDSSWKEMSYDVSSVADGESAVYIRWGMGTTDRSVTYCGWNIDDVEIAGNQGSVLFMELPDQATEGDGILSLAGTVHASPAPASNLVINLASTDPMDVGVPSSVTILAGQTNATFDLVIHDDSLLEGTQTITFTAAADDYAEGVGTMEVHDNETATLSLSLPMATFEGAGSIGGSLMLNAVPVKDVVVSLVSNDPTEIGSTNVTLSAGLNIARFNLSVIDDNLIDGIQSATITAHVQNWTDGVGSIFIQDNESSDLTVQLPSTASEGDGVLTNAGVVSVAGVISFDTHIVLTCSDTSEIMVPDSVTIPAGQLSATFDVSVVDDTDADGTQNLSVVGNSPGFIPGFDAMSISDNELHHFSVGSVNSQQVAGVSFNLVFAAENIENEAIATFNGSPTLSAEGDAGALEVVPATIAFESGQWSGDVFVNEIGDTVHLLVDDGAGHIGTSTVFNVTGSQIVITPDSLTNTLVVAGETFTRTMVISNAGNVDLEFVIQGAGESPVDPSLVAYFPFNGNANDESGNGNDGTVVGATLTSDRFGDPDSAYSFDGSNDRIDLVNESSYDFERTDSFSQSFWVKTGYTGSSDKFIFSKLESPFVDTGYGILVLSGKLRIYLIHNHPNNEIRIDTDRFIADSKWHHVVVAYDGSSKAAGVSIYVDNSPVGKMVGADGLSGSILNDVVPTIGYRKNQYYFAGQIDDIRVFSKELSAADVGELYNEGIEMGLIANYPFNGNADDESGSGYDGSVVGATLTADRFGNADSAFEFDGNGDYIDIGNCLGTENTPFTLSAWVWSTNCPADGYEVFISKKTQGVWDSGQWQLYANPELVGFIVNDRYSDAVTERNVTSPRNIHDGAWHHILGVMSSDGAKLYIDGEFVGSNTNINLVPQHNSKILIGSRNDPSARRYMDGLIDDVRIYNRALSAAEITNLYNAEEETEESWLSVDPKTGTVPPGSSVAVSVRFDAAGLVAGDYAADLLKITSNDVFVPSNAVPASMWVLPPAPTMAMEPEFTAGTSNQVAWSVVDGPVSYLTEVVASTNTAALQQSGWMAATNHTFGSLTTNVVYYYHVKASVSSGIGLLEGSWSDWVQSKQVVGLDDLDSDLMPDWWEQLYFGGPANCDPLADSDGDGQNNRDEFIAGMDPTNPDSCFMVRTVDSPTNGMFVVSWDSVTGRVYSVYWKTNLPAAFQSLETGIHHPQNSYTDSVHNAEIQGFYRIGVELE